MWVRCSWGRFSRWPRCDPFVGWGNGRTVEFNEGVSCKKFQLWPIRVLVRGIGVGFLVVKAIMQVQDGQLCVSWHTEDIEVIVGQCVRAPQKVAVAVTT